MLRILLVEDNVDVSFLISQSLKSIGTVDVAVYKKDVETLLEKSSYDLAILDLSLPDCHGYEIFKLIKQKANSARSIIVLSGDDSESSQIEGFNLGIDDYIVKPVKINILKAKIQNKLKGDLFKSNVINFGPLSVDLSLFQAFVSEANHTVRTSLDLTPIEFKILVLLLKNQNQVVTRQLLLVEAWNGSIYVGPRVIDQHVSALRKKLGKYSDYVKTVYGAGYKMGIQDSASVVN